MSSNRYLRLNKIFIILNVIFFIYASISITLLVFFDEFPYLRYVVDTFDIEVWYSRFGEWALKGELPYTGSEGYDYPHLSVYLCGLPYIFVSDIKDYIIFMLVLFTLVGFLNLKLVYILIKKFQLETSSFSMFLIPTILYFMQCRFESICTFFVLLSLLYLKKEKYFTCFIMLSLVFWIKWYILCVVPLYLSYIYNKESKKLEIKREDISFLIKMKMISPAILGFLIVSFILVVPSLIFGDIIMVLWSYIFQFHRISNHEGYGALFSNLFGIEELPQIQIFGISFGALPLLLIQFSILIIGFFIRVRNFDELFKGCSFVIMWFIVFAKYHSPQWLIWVIVFLFISSIFKENKTSVVILTLYWGICNYVLFNLSTDFIVFYIILLSRYICQYILLVLIFRKISFERFNKSLIYLYRRKFLDKKTTNIENYESNSKSC